MEKARIGLLKKKKKNKTKKKTRSIIGYPYLSLLARKTFLMPSSTTTLKKKKKKKKKKKSARVGVCDLPDEILVNILSLLPTKSAVATSILSKRWHNLWTFITNLELDEDLFKERSQFINFMDAAMALRKGSSLESFSLQCRVFTNDEASRVNAWITSAIQCNVEKLALDLDTDTDYDDLLPGCLFDCQSLVKFDLKMWFDTLRVPPCSISVLSNLKSLRLYGVTFPDDESAERLLSSPLLEELSIKSCYCDGVRAIRVSTPRLKVLEIEEEDDDDDDDVNHKVCFVADNLWTFRYKGFLYNEYQICSSSAQLSTATIDVASGLLDRVRNIVVCANRLLKLINGVSKAHSLTLNFFFLKALESILEQDDTMLIFECLTSLTLKCTRNNYIVLTKILERSPHLERLDITEIGDVFVSSPVLMYLKRIYIGTCTYHHEGKKDAISVLLNSCTVLEIMEINHLYVCGLIYKVGTEKMQKKLNGRPRVSKNCKIVVKHAHEWMCGCCRTRVPRISMH